MERHKVGKIYYSGASRKMKDKETHTIALRTYFAFFVLIKGVENA